MATPRRTAAPGPRHVRALSALSRQPFSAARAARLIATVTLAVTIVSGVVIHWADKTNFPNVGRGLWWAVQTVTTVGYGDVVPTTTPGRLIAALVMIVGIAFLAVTTAAIASTFVEAARRHERDEGELLAAKLDQISARLDAIEGRISAIWP
ncbi:MAG TPA: potassium channel family protein [Solirubrobacteraceae bacterium]|nr:potassium channel family protein [Solirubrobacteraceae bacterium]